MLAWIILIAGVCYGFYFFITAVMPALVFISVLSALGASKRNEYHVYHHPKPECAIM